VGYRYDEATGVAPLFAFGQGLSYTRFALSGLEVHTTPRGASVSVRVANLGARRGVAVPEVYLTDPPAAGEPPNQLAAFSAVPLRPHAAARVTLEVPLRSFEAYLGAGWTTVPGLYTLSVGQSSVSLPLRAELPAPVR
ncbi:MAG TPA: fibronectin type III-like domain-contianing protein, partial [Acidimicrobiales bacterium]|nr:fibronectin type III-like domain-contianing protein [Acidimicrobiales bacterium]